MDDDDFQKKLDTVIAAWEDHAVSSTADVNGFIRWFKLNKSLVVRDYMLRGMWFRLSTTTIHYKCK